MAKRWYSVSVLSNFEKKIAEAIRIAVEEKGLQDQIEEVLVPTEEVIEVRRGKKITTGNVRPGLSPDFLDQPGHRVLGLLWQADADARF